MRPLMMSYLLAGMMFYSPVQAATKEAEKPALVDAHLHYVNFMQETDGTSKLLQAMDDAGVEKAWIFGLPVIKKWEQSAPKKPRYYSGDEAPLYYYSGTDDILARDLMALPEEQRERFAPFISGINPTDMNAANQIERLIERYPGLWRGIGEILTRHDVLSGLTHGETSRADHPALMKVYKLAARHRLPILLHSNLSSMREDEPIYLPELETALSKNPDTRFVLAHAGTSESIEALQKPMKKLPKILATLLESYPNLSIDLSWSVREHYLFEGEQDVDSEWLALIQKFPDRFLLGSDKVGRFAGLDKNLGGYAALLNKLEPEEVEMLRRKNALALLPVRAAGSVALADDPALARK